MALIAWVRTYPETPLSDRATFLALAPDGRSVADATELGLWVRPLESGKANLLELLPDVQVYHNAVRYALHHNEFFNAKEIPVGKELLKQGESAQHAPAAQLVAPG